MTGADELTLHRDQLLSSRVIRKQTLALRRLRYSRIDASPNSWQQDDGETDELDQEKLRAYQLSRLRYYYAIVDCDSAGVPRHLVETDQGRDRNCQCCL